VTETPYRLQHEIKEYGRPVGVILVSKSGYDPYLSSLSVKKSKLAELTPCLKKLVPIVQQAQVDYIRNATATNKVMVDVVTGMKSFWTLSMPLLAFGNRQALKYQIISNGPDRTLGNFNMPRVAKVIADFHSTFGDDVKTADPNVKPSTIVTNQFIDRRIGL
jgi:hypothetical protein